MSPRTNQPHVLRTGDIMTGKLTVRGSDDGVNAVIDIERLITGAVIGRFQTASNTFRVGTVGSDFFEIATNNTTRVIVAPGTGNVGVGLSPATTMSGVSVEAGIVTLKEITTPQADADYGKVYPKADNKLYFQDGAGNEHELSVAGHSH